MIIDDFKKLIDNNRDKFTDDEYGLFSDSIRCFHSGIYRPAYIMAYQAVMIYFRRLLLGAQKPASFVQNKWDKLIYGLKNDKEWEDAVNNAIRMKNYPTATPPEVAVLDIPDEQRADFDFWRRRRNDSAHYKAYHINDSHVLAFYSFLNQYLMTISVEGGTRSLLKELKDACDDTKTSQKASLQPYVNKITSMVRQDEMDDFFDGLQGITYPKPFGRLDEIFEIIIKGTDEKLKGKAIEYIRQNRKDEFINRNPWMVGHILDLKEVRPFWKQNLHFCGNRLSVIAQLLQARMIDSSEKEECLKSVIEQAYGNNEGIGDLSDDEKQTLVENGILDCLHILYFNSEHTSNHARECGQNHYIFFNGFMRLVPLDAIWVKILIDIFETGDYPIVWLNILQERYLCDANYKQKFHDVCIQNGYVIPDWAK